MTNNLPTIDIKGKDYVLVKDRVLYFNDNFPNGSIETELVSSPDSKTVVVKAIVTPDVKNPTRRFVDYSQAVVGQGMVNTTSALENASTSAIGRALGIMGIGVIESIASADEMNKALNATPKEVSHGVCPKDKGKLIEKETKAGKKFLKCENGGYDVETRQPTGCTYVDWLNPVIPVTNKQNPYGNPDEVMTIEDWESLKSGKDVKPNAVGESFGTEPI